MSRRNWYISHCALYLCAMCQVLWSGLTLTFTSALFSLTFFLLGLTENSSTGFQGGVFHLRQSSLPSPTRRPFDARYLFWDPTFQRVVWSEIYSGFFVHCGLKKISLFLCCDAGDVLMVLSLAIFLRAHAACSLNNANRTKSAEQDWVFSNW